MLQDFHFFKKFALKQRQRKSTMKHLLHGYNGLVLSAGAAGGYYHLGALHAIWTETSALKNVKYIAGSSVGAALALLLACGYQPVELFATLCTKDINKVFEFEIANLSTEWGLIDNKKLYEYLECLVLDKMNYIPTLKQLQEDTGKTLIIPSWCVTHSHNEHQTYFTPTTHPDINVIDAVMCSSNIPVLFTKAKVDDHLWIDGAIFDKCPAGKIKSYMTEQGETDFKNLVLNLKLSSTRMEEKPKTLINYIKNICYVPLKLQKSPVDDDVQDVLHLESELSAMTLTIDLKARIDIFTGSYNKVKTTIKDVIQLSSTTTTAATETST
jgi:predicted acylesterase/phospholipase RssA